MAPLKPKGGASKVKVQNKNKTKGRGVTKSASSSSSRSSSSSKAKSRPPSKEQKSKPATAKTPKKKKKRVYTEKELGIPKLNTIVPAGVGKVKGKKKGKVFVDDQESMMTILAMVNADKEGQIESKMMKARQMEEIRQARQAEMNARQEEKKSKLEDTKNSLRRQRKHKGDENNAASDVENQPAASSKSSKAGKKRVSFA